MGKFINAINNMSNTIKNVNYSIQDVCETLNNIDHNIIATNIYLKRVEDKYNSSTELVECTSESTRIRPCLYFDNEGEHSVALHSFNGNMAIIEFSNGKVKEVSLNDIQLLDSKVALNDFCRIDDIESLKRYWGNEECFKKYYDRLKKENPELFVND